MPTGGKSRRERVTVKSEAPRHEDRVWADSVRTRKKSLDGAGVIRLIRA
jgi:hypothetical protein